MSNIKRLSLALLALGLSAPAFAADCCSSSVLVPSQHGGFKVGIDALYLRPTSSGLDYATLVLNNQTNFALGYERNQVIDPSYDWGVYAQVGYLFPCTGNDLTLGYTYLNNNNTSSVIAPTPGTDTTSNSGIAVLPLSVLAQATDPDVLTDPVLFGAVEGKSEYTLNVVDLEAGQRFTTGAYDMRMFAGLRYANIDTTLKSFAHPFPEGSTGDVNTSLAGFQDFHSQFRGIGPRIGVDARYCLSSGFGLDADLSTSLLVGTVDSHYNAAVIDTTTTPPTATLFTSRNGSNTRVIPVIEAKLGGDYTYIMDCRCKSALVLEAGYQVTNYFNASDHHTRVVSTDGGSFLSNGDCNNIAFDGPYLGVKYYA